MALALLLPALGAQANMVGTWKGDWGPAPDHRNPVTLVLAMENGALTGTINPDAENIKLTKVTVNSDGTVEMAAQAPGRRGATFSYTITGKVEGSTFTGTWSHDNRMGDFKVTKE